jgi:hypothetical protein
MSRLAVVLLAALVSLPMSQIAMTSSADAQVTVNINIGSNISGGRSISCSRGEQILRNRGFRSIRRIDCRGRNFVYRAFRGRNYYEIAVRARDGRVLDYRRIRGSFR